MQKIMPMINRIGRIQSYSQLCPAKCRPIRNSVVTPASTKTAGARYLAKMLRGRMDHSMISMICGGFYFANSTGLGGPLANRIPQYRYHKNY